MIAGFRAGEIDVAFDLQDSDLPKVQDLGEQVAAIPALLYEFLRPNWSPGPFKTDGANEHRRLLPQPGRCRSRPRLPDRRPGDPRGDRLRDRQERDQHAPAGRQRPGREHEHQPVGVVLRRPAPGHLRSRARPSRSWPTAAGSTPTVMAFVEKDGLTAKIELCTTTRQVRQDTLALVSGWLKAVGIDSRHQPRRPVRHLRRLQRGDRRHPLRPLAQQLRPGRARVLLLDRPARQLLQLPQQPVPAQRRQRRPGEQPGASTRPSTPSRTPSTSTSSRTRWPPSRRCTSTKTDRGPALLPQERGACRAEARQLLRQRHPGRLDLERPGLVRPGLSSARPRDSLGGAPGTRAPHRRHPHRSARRCTVRATSGRRQPTRPPIPARHPRG